VVGQPSARSTLAQRLAYLINLRPADRGGPWSDAQIAEGIEKQGLGKLTVQTIWRLRTGRDTNPKLATLEMLASFFGVKISYFTDDDPSDHVAQIRFLLARRDGDVQNVLMRMGELSDESLRAISGMIEHLLASERRHGRGRP
jgi:transcriptional regulator with XRE-family HTH domain